MPSTLSIADNIQAEDLETKLKSATSLSEDQIKEIVPVILKSISEIKKLEEEKTESTTKQGLSSLAQSIESNQDVSIDMKTNKGTVIGAMNFNTITNNISITINNPKPTTQNTPRSTTNTPQTTINNPKPTTQNTPRSTTNTPQTTINNPRPTTQNTPQSTTQTTINNPKPTIESEALRDIYDPNNFLLVLNELLQEIEDTRAGISKKHQSKAGKEAMDAAKTKLKQYEKQIKGKKEAIERQLKRHVTPKITENDINMAKKLKSDIDTVRETDVSLGQRGELSNQGAFLYNSPEVARKSNIAQEKLNQFEQVMKEEVKNGAILNIFNQKEELATEFYRKIAEGRYTQAEYSVYRAYDSILNPSFQRCGITVPILTPSQLSSTGTTQAEQRIQIEQGSQTTQTTTAIDYSGLDRGESFARGGLSGRIDKALSSCHNLTPGQRNTWKSVAVIGCFAGAIYGLYKFYTKKDMSLLKKAGITAGAIFGTQVLTGENPISLFKKLMTGGFSVDDLKSKFGSAFGDAVDGVQGSGIEGADNVSGAIYSLMVFNETTKVGDVRALSSRFKNNPQEWTLFRGQAITKLGERNFERFSAVFSENFDENKWNEWLNSIGIHEGIDDNKLVYELASAKTMNTAIINKFLSDNGKKVTNNKAKKEEFEQYKKSANDNNQIINISILQTHKDDRFIDDNDATFTDRPEDTQNKEKLRNQVDQLSLDDQTKAELKREIQLFYDERPIKSKPNLNDFSLEMENNLLILKSHRGEKTKIDLQHKTLTGFGSSGTNKYEIPFTRIKDLINVADLTNDILSRQRNKPIASTPAFQYKPERKGICFNDAETLSFNFDTRVLSTGWGGATRKIDTLCEHPAEYAEYLSNRRVETLSPQTQQTTPQTQQRAQS